MGKKFHKNSVYIFLLRLIILLVDLIGLNLILFTVQQIWKPTFLVNDIHGITNWLHAFYNITWIILSYFFRTYESNFEIGKNIRSSFQLFVIHSFISVSAIFLSGIKIVEPNVLTIYAIFAFSFLPISRFITKFILNKIDQFIHLRKRAILIGNGTIYPKLFTYLTSENSGYRLIKNFPTTKRESKDFDKLFNEIIHFSIQNEIKEIFSTIKPSNLKTHKDLIALAEKNFIRLRFVSNADRHYLANREIKDESEIPLTADSYEPLDDLDNRIRKRIFDVLVSLFVVTFVLSWLWPIIALLIKLDSKGPVVFKQWRSGKNNKPFLCFKFRTMIPNDEQETKQAVRNDYRFTTIGAFLRKTNLDELPQFFNVLFGQMSIIGPRPHMLNHTLEYSESVDSFMRRHFIKPGISGWAQVNGLRGNLNQNLMEERVKYDLYYIKNWSIWVDFEILFKTILITIFGDEAAY